MSLETQRIAFVGGGAMAEALAGGLLAAGVPAAAIRAADPDAERRDHLTRSLGITADAGNARVARDADIVVVAVKPALVGRVLPELASALAEDALRPLWISIAAGVPLARLEAALPPGARIVRSMPNTPALIRCGATGLCGNAHASASDLALARALFESVGSAWEAPKEALLDAVTGLSGSGPAYVFAFLEALVDAGEAAGLPRAAASELALQTLYGAARLARESARSPAELRRQVSSPGGTTLAGLARLEAHGLAEALRDAVAVAARRAGELGREG
jgi:pyrroline-5-carboxylate reductase